MSALALLAGLSPYAGASPTARVASAFNPRGTYDCLAYQSFTHGYAYVDSYRFAAGGRYSVGGRGPGASVTRPSTGRYTRVGEKIVGLSGVLKSQHFYLLIQTNDLSLMRDNGQFTGIGCYPRTKPKPIRRHRAGSFPPGNYSCYYTTQDPTGGYQSTFQFEVDLFADGTYFRSGNVRGPAWHQSGRSIQFTAGPLWDASQQARDVGTWYPSGTSMPHATNGLTGNKFTLVIRDTRNDNGVPPMSQFTGSTPMSFSYCKR